MDRAYEDFKKWYVGPLEKLYPYRDAGFPILMVTFPLLERYLRHKSDLSFKDNLNKNDKRFFSELTELFPELPAEMAEDFWKVYRNGILHQVTLMQISKFGKELPDGWLSHDLSSPLEVGSQGTFLIHPVLFSKRAIAKIQSDFVTFFRPMSKYQQFASLPRERPYPSASGTILGTSCNKE